MDVTDISDGRAILEGLLRYAEKVYAQVDAARPRWTSRETTRMLLDVARRILDDGRSPEAAGTFLERAMDELLARRDAQRGPRPRPWSDDEHDLERWRLMRLIRRAETLLRFPEPRDAKTFRLRAVVSSLALEARIAITARDEEAIERTRRELPAAIAALTPTQRN